MAGPDVLVGAPDFVGPPEPPPTNTWIARAAETLIEVLTSRTFQAQKLAQWLIDHRVQIEAYLLNAGLKGAIGLIDIVAGVVTSGAPLAANLAAKTINQIVGTDIDPDAITRDFLAQPTRDSIVDIGARFHPVLDKMFPIADSAVNNKDRADRQFSVDNLNAYFGTNMSFQLRSLAIGTIAAMVPKLELRHLEGLHQSINWAYGFGWLSWSVLSAVMGVTTTKPLTEYYNAKIKGNDFSEAEALKAFTQGFLSAGELNKVLDNQGMRDDIRQTRIDQTWHELSIEQAVKAFVQQHINGDELTRILNYHGVREKVRLPLIELAKGDLTEGDITQGYQEGLFSAQDVHDHYVEKGFFDFNLKAKEDLVADDRLFKLRAKLATAYHHAYVLGTATQQEYSDYLSSINFTGLEIDMELKRAEVEGRVRSEKHLTKAEIIRLASHGGLDPQDALQKLKGLGVDDLDARMLLADAILEHAYSVVPSKVKNDCLTPQFEQNIITTGLNVALQLDPTYAVRNRDFVSLVQCIIANYAALLGAGGGGGGGGGTGVLPPLPTTPAQHPGLPTPEDSAFACLLWRYVRANQPIPATAAAWMIQNAGANAMVIAQNDPACQ